MAELIEIKREPHENCAVVVSMLETLLEQARAGDVVALGIAVVYPDRSTGTAYSYADFYHQLNSAALMLSHRINGDG